MYEKLLDSEIILAITFGTSFIGTFFMDAKNNYVLMLEKLFFILGVIFLISVPFTVVYNIWFPL